MFRTVHLDGVRCDGGQHGGCQATCLIFWKEAWLKRVSGRDADAAKNGSPSTVGPSNRPGPGSSRCTEAAVLAASQVSGEPGNPGGTRYSCQATDLLEASVPLPWWDVRQYVRDLLTGNVRPWDMAKAGLISAFNALQRRRGGGTYPHVGKTDQTKTPTEKLDLQPGELVQIKSREEIFATLDPRKRNRGLSFDVEMVGYCGGTYRVLKRAETIIDERTGKMIRLPNDCIILEGVYCVGHLSRNRLFCPRAIYPFWREIWLRRVNTK